MVNLEIIDGEINPNDYPVGVVVCRMQVHKLHEAHEALINKVINNHKMVIIFLGVSVIPNTKKNPLDFATRVEMIREKYSNVIILPLKDMRSNADWAKQLDDSIGMVFGGKRALLYGSRDSFIPYYSPYGKHATVELSTDTHVSGTEVRVNVSKEIKSSSDFRAGVIYSNYSRWNTTYPTVDICAYNKEGELLLAKKPNESKWRFIGGFVDSTDENLEAAAKREFSEETGGGIVTNLEYIGSSKVNDWRYNGLTDGIMTTLFLGEIGNTEIVPTDDINELSWFNVQEFENYEKIENQIVPEHLYLMVVLINYINNK